jgi:hypothetical protein
MFTYSDVNKESTKTPAFRNNSDPSHTTNKEISKLAQRFSDTIPSGESTVAELQAFLFSHRDAPQDALTYASKWSEWKRKEVSSSAVEETIQENDYLEHESIINASTVLGSDTSGSLRKNRTLALLGAKPIASVERIERIERRRSFPETPEVEAEDVGPRCKALLGLCLGFGVVGANF